VTHSLCTLEFEVHRPLYDWLVEAIGIYAPQQIEFARLNLSYTVLSKRRSLELVEGGHVNGWDDPRMPTVAGLRRRGYTPEALRKFVEKVGIAKRNNVIDVALLEHTIREDLNVSTPRVMCVLDPIKVIIDNYPDGQEEDLDAVNNPEDPSMGSRKVKFSKQLYIEREDFMEDPPNKFFRLAPGKEVRLRYAYFVTCVEVIKDEKGEIKELHCTYDPETKGGSAPDGRKVKGTLHWVSANHALPIEVRLYDRLFVHESPESVEGDFKDHLNPDSLKVITGYAETEIKKAKTGDRYQFERKGYYCVDPDSRDEKPVFNQIVTLRDSWAKKK